MDTEMINETVLEDSVDFQNSPEIVDESPVEIAYPSIYVESNFNLPLNKWLKRADTVEIASNLFVSVSIETNKESEIVVFADGKIHYREVTESGDLVVFKLTRREYGASAKQGASALQGLTRIVESSDTLFMSAMRDASGKIAIVGIYRKQRENGQTSLADTRGLGFESLPLNDGDSDVFASMINRFIRRAIDGKNPRDARKDQPENSMYAKFVAQKAAK